MSAYPADHRSDCVVVGANFAGLACAISLATRGMRVTVLERKVDPVEKLHTTGIIVKDAVDQIALLDGLPSELIRRVNGVRLYSPNMKWVELSAPGYYFLTAREPCQGPQGQHRSTGTNCH
ncbi:MAG: NAD(P)/FAD-dependent oxidoreductase [Burkholderiales bacterium]